MCVQDNMGGCRMRTGRGARAGGRLSGGERLGFSSGEETTSHHMEAGRLWAGRILVGGHSSGRH